MLKDVVSGFISYTKKFKKKSISIETAFINAGIAQLKKTSIFFEAVSLII